MNGPIASALHLLLLQVLLLRSTGRRSRLLLRWFHPVEVLVESVERTTRKCWQLTKAPVEARRERIRDAGLCYICLRRGHIAKECTERCANCGRRHHRLCCTPHWDPPGSATPLPPVADDALATAAPSFAVSQHCSASLQTASVLVACADGRYVEATALLDSGSDRSYVTSDMVRKVSPRYMGKANLNYAPFGSKKPTSLDACMYQIVVSSHDHSTNVACPLTFVEVPTI